jgi:hypothetical protein
LSVGLRLMPTLVGCACHPRCTASAPIPVHQQSSGGPRYAVVPFDIPYEHRPSLGSSAADSVSTHSRHPADPKTDTVLRVVGTPGPSVVCLESPRVGGSIPPQATTPPGARRSVSTLPRQPDGH